MSASTPQPALELMAPVGSREALAAALQAGADAVYFGVEDLNMRAHSAKAFTLDDLSAIAATCRAAGVKSYLTVNTVIYDEEFEKLDRILEAAAAAKISAVIAADVAVLVKARALGIEVHLSTQLNIANVEALKFYARFADVVVLARELSLEQVAAIARAVDEGPILGPSGQKVRLEAFVHGALCMAVSGKCYLSLHTKGKSGNRGECLQPCRRTYAVFDKERGTELEIDNEYIMSPKDLKTIEILDKLVAAGITVFKIEGRARGADYVYTTVKCYREALDAVLCGDFARDPHRWDEKLKAVFNRDFWTGYYLDSPTGEWTDRYGSKAAKKKVFAGKCTGYYAKAGVGRFLVQSGEIEEGDELLVIGPTTGVVAFRAQAMRVDEQPARVATKGADLTIALTKRIRENDRLYKVVPTEFATPKTKDADAR